MLCKRCGSTVSDSSAFCPYCGAAAAQPQSPQMPPRQSSTVEQPYDLYDSVPEPPKKKSHKGLIIGIVAFLLIAVIAAVAAFFLLSDDDEDSSSKESSSHSSTEDDEEDEDSDSEDKDSDDEDKDSDDEDKDSDDKDSKNSRDPEEVAEAFMSGIFSGDLDGAFGLFPGDVIAEAEDDLDELADELEPFYEEMDEYGVVFSVKATDSEAVDADALAQIQEMYEDEFGIEVTDAQTVELEITAEMDGEEDTEDFSLIVIEVDGSWYVEAVCAEELLSDPYTSNDVSSDPAQVAEDFLNSLYSGDLDGALTMLPQEVLDTAEEDLEVLDEMLTPYYEDLEAYGIEISVTATNSEALDDDEIEELMALYEDDLDITLDITQAQMVELDMTAEMNGETETIGMALAVIKVDGLWYVDVISMNDAF